MNIEVPLNRESILRSNLQFNNIVNEKKSSVIDSPHGNALRSNYGFLNQNSMDFMANNDG